MEFLVIEVIEFGFCMKLFVEGRQLITRVWGEDGAPNFLPLCTFSFKKYFTILTPPPLPPKNVISNFSHFSFTLPPSPVPYLDFSSPFSQDPVALLCLQEGFLPSRFGCVIKNFLTIEFYFLLAVFLSTDSSYFFYPVTVFLLFRLVILVKVLMQKRNIQKVQEHQTTKNHKWLLITPLLKPYFAVSAR